MGHGRAKEEEPGFQAPPLYSATPMFSERAHQGSDSSCVWKLIISVLKRVGLVGLILPSLPLSHHVENWSLPSSP